MNRIKVKRRFERRQIQSKQKKRLQQKASYQVLDDVINQVNNKESVDIPSALIAIQHIFTDSEDLLENQVALLFPEKQFWPLFLWILLKMTTTYEPHQFVVRTIHESLRKFITVDSFFNIISIDLMPQCSIFVFVTEFPEQHYHKQTKLCFSENSHLMIDYTIKP